MRDPLGSLIGVALLVVLVLVALLLARALG